MLNRTGIPTQAELNRVLPLADRIEQGAAVIIECFESIPCNPCVDSCLQRAISIEGNINNLPQVDYTKCNGCGMCISGCPGLAIFVVHKNYDSKQGLVMLPYEFLPLPKVDDIVAALSRKGNKICEAKVSRVLLTKRQDRTAIISILVPKELIMEVRNIAITKSKVQIPNSK
ncbi:MAG: 4Fe-4S binding protein [Candidatus Stahlbacteria bacterium]|nr:4Fe-4S binding protein [Candidatus Stahlbacteria bacterium]